MLKSLHLCLVDRTLQISLLDSIGQNPAIGCPRHLLRRSTTKLKDSFGLKAICGIEFEIHLFKDINHDKSGTAPKSNREPYALSSRSYSLTELSHQQRFADEFLAATECFGCSVYAYHTEMGPSVTEVTLLHTECCTAADNAVLLPWLMSTIGVAHQMRPSFMAKPFHDSAGASGHIHRKIWPPYRIPIDNF